MNFNDDVNSWINSLRRTYNNKFNIIHYESDTYKPPAKTDLEKALIKHPKSQAPSEMEETKCPALELFISKVKSDISSYTCNRKHNNPSNIDKDTQDAIKEIKSWDDTVIGLFDKGSGFFILNKDDYIKRTRIELDDISTFKPIIDQQLATQQCIDAVKNWTNNYSEELGMSKSIIDWVTPDVNNSAGNNYINLKAHKPEKNFPGRLISTGCNSFTKNLAVLTNYELRKVKLVHNVQDTNNFLCKLDDLNESGVLENKSILLCSFDICSMFPSISKDLGLQVCKEHLDKRENKVFSTQCIIDAITITLDHNLTVFNGCMFKQIKCVAMGASNACDYADVTMSDLDELIHSDSLVDDHGQSRPLLFARFRDDIFVVWDAGYDNLIKFYNFLNSFHNDIKFTMTEPSTEAVEFLDTFVFMKKGILHTKPYSKECDSHSYLLPNSCHPMHTLKNIPFSIAHRIFKISSDHEIYEEAKAEYTKYLKDRGYSDNIISESFAKVERLDRNIIIRNRKSTDSDIVNVRNFPLVCDFNPALPPVGKFINKHKYLLELDPLLCEVIRPNKIFVSYRGNPTIKDLLVPSKIKVSNNNSEVSDIDHKLGCFKCEKGCKFCKDFLDFPNNVWSYHTEQVFSFQHKLDCKSKNVIYKIDDIICKRSYVGSTVTGMNERWRNHKSHIRQGVKSCELTSHFSNEDALQYHKIDKKANISHFDSTLKGHLRVTIIDQFNINESDNNLVKLSKCKEREAYWQNQLRNLNVYGGFNKRDSRRETKLKSYSSCES